MFNRTERLYLLYAETQGFINPEQASRAEEALRAAGESGQETTPWELLKEWQYLSPEQTTALFNAVERAVAKCERHPLVVSGSPTAETTEHPAVGDPFDAAAEPHPEMPAVPSLPQTPAEGTQAGASAPGERPEPDTVSPILDDTPTPTFNYVTPQEVEPEVSPPSEIPGLAATPEESPESTVLEKPSLVIPSLAPPQKEQEETETKPDPETKKKTKVRKKKTKTKGARKEKTKQIPVVGTAYKTEHPVPDEEKPAEEFPATEPAPEAPEPATEISADESAETPTDSRETESSEVRETAPASETTEPVDNLPAEKPEAREKQSKPSKPLTTITRRSRAHAAEAQSRGSTTAIAVAIAAVLVLCGGVYFYVNNSNEEKPKRLKMAKAKEPKKDLTKTEGIDAIFGERNSRVPIGGRGQVTASQADKTEQTAETKQTAETDIATDQQLEAAKAAQKIAQAQRELRQKIRLEKKTTAQEKKSKDTAQPKPTENVAQLKKELDDLTDFFGQDDRIWLGNETFKGKHDGEKNILNIYTGSPAPEDGMIKGSRIYTNAPHGTLCSVFLLRKKGNKLKVIERMEFLLDSRSREYVNLGNLNWTVKKGDLLAHWGMAPARKEADTADECYVLSKEPAKDAEISLAGKKKLPRRKYALRAEFVVPEPEKQKKK